MEKYNTTGILGWLLCKAWEAALSIDTLLTIIIFQKLPQYNVSDFGKQSLKVAYSNKKNCVQLFHGWLAS
jgi:hypothetical protein